MVLKVSLSVYELSGFYGLYFLKIKFHNHGCFLMIFIYLYKITYKTFILF